METEDEKIEKLEDILDAKRKAFDYSSCNSFEELEASLEPESSELDTLYAIRRFNQVPKYSKTLPDYGDVMKLDEFIDCCKSGGFIDYDGSGHYVKDGKCSDVYVYPSDIMEGRIRREFDSVCWYNR